MIQNSEYQQMVINTLCKSLKEVAPEIRAKAAESLGKLGVQAAVPFLIPRLGQNWQFLPFVRHGSKTKT